MGGEFLLVLVVVGVVIGAVCAALALRRARSTGRSPWITAALAFVLGFVLPSLLFFGVGFVVRATAYFGERDQRFRERDRCERSVLSCVEWIVGSGCLKVVERLRGLTLSEATSLCGGGVLRRRGVAALGLHGGRFARPHRLAFEVQAMAARQQPVEDRVGNGCIADPRMPVLDG